MRTRRITLSSPPRFQDVPQYTQWGSYAVDVSWRDLPTYLKKMREYGLNLEPDFQRGHVWTRDKQQAYVEFILRGGRSARDILTNCVGWNLGLSKDFVLVDGLQRITAALAFLHNELPVFGGHLYRDFRDPLRHHAGFKWHVNDLESREEVLQWYLDLNSGGVVHTPEELGRVRQLLDAERAANASWATRRGNAT